MFFRDLFIPHVSAGRVSSSPTCRWEGFLLIPHVSARGFPPHPPRVGGRVSSSSPKCRWEGFLIPHVSVGGSPHPPRVGGRVSGPLFTSLSDPVSAGVSLGPSVSPCDLSPTLGSQRTPPEILSFTFPGVRPLWCPVVLVLVLPVRRSGA